MPGLHRVGRTGLLALLVVLASACDESTGNSGTIQIVLSPAQVSVAQGGSGTTTVTLTRTGDFTGVVTLAVTGLPGGAAASITPVQLTGTATTASIEIGAGTGVPPGTSTVTVIATADGVTQASASLQLSITQAPDFRVTSTTNSLTVNAGASGSATVNIERTNFVGEIALSLVNPPTGITATFTPATTTGNTSTMAISVDPTVTPATYPLLIQGTAGLVGARTTQLVLTVQAPPGAFTMALSPGSFTMDRGNTAIVNITLSRTDYTGPISLAFENSAPGITGTIVPASTTGNAAVLTIDVGDAVPAGIYQLRIRASATGFIDRVGFVQVTVTIPTGGVVEYLYCDASQVPVFFAYQDGVGAWQTVTSTTAGGITKFVFTLVQGRGGVLAVYQTSSPFVSDALRVRGTQSVMRQARTRRDGGSRVARRLAPSTPSRALLVEGYQTEVLYGTAAELVHEGVTSCGVTQEASTMTGTVTGVSSGQYGIASLGDVTEVFNGSVSTNPVTFTGVQGGQVDLVASRTTPGNVPDRIVVLRNIDVVDGTSLPAAIDFGGPASTTPATAMATLTGATTDLLEMFTSVVTTHSHGLLWFDLNPNSNTSRPWAGLNSTTLGANEFHGLTAFATPFTGGASDFRVTLRYVAAVADQTLAFGPLMTSATATQVVGGAYPRYRFQGSIPAEYNKGVSVDIVPDNPGSGYSMMASSAWLAAAGNAQAYDLTMPDVAGLAGFPAAARLAPGPNDAAVSGFGFTGVGIFDLRPALGQEFKAASRSVTIGVP